ncbi:MAG: type II secretion system F family protein [Acidimicrobiia bacterium]|nr:type II secretion system F family protein [Acidimicrobiia bacterium]
MKRWTILGTVTLAAASLPTPALAQSTADSGSSTRPLLIGLAIAGVIFLLGLLLAGFGMSGGTSDVRSRLGRMARPVANKGWLAKVPFLGRFVIRAEEEARRRGVLDAVSSAVERAGIPMRSGEAIAAGLGLSALIGISVGAAAGNALGGIAAGAGGVIFVVVAIQALAARETRKFDEQLPDTLNLLGSSLRAGYSLLQAVEGVSKESAMPTSREFGRAVSDIRLGSTVSSALNGVANRMGSVDFEWVTMAIDIQTEVGGNLAEVLQTTGETIILRNRLRRDVHAMTSEGRISAIVLGILPFGLGAFLYVSNRDYLTPLFDTTEGRVGLAVAFGLLVAGIAWIRAIVNVEA